MIRKNPWDDRTQRAIEEVQAVINAALPELASKLSSRSSGERRPALEELSTC